MFHGDNRSSRSVCSIFGLVFVLICLGACASHPGGGAGDGRVLGIKTWQGWQKETGLAPYPDGRMAGLESKLERIAELQSRRQAEFFIFGGAWCPDTQTQLPRIMKILDLSGVSDNRYRLYGVDLEKNEPSGAARAFSIEKVPTLVVVSGGKEIGRVVEYPEVSWEDDLIALLSR